jgi:transcriptional regulator with XRE-family HTH domain
MLAPGSASLDLTPIVGSNLRRLRTKRGLSLERLARASGVSRAMLSQIELGRSAPTINLVWKIASALGVPLSVLVTDRGSRRPAVMRASAARVRTSRDGAFVSRALFPLDPLRLVELYELYLAPLSAEKAEAHPAGTTENLVVVSGALTLVIGNDRYRLGVGDAILFEADVPHEYRNEREERLHMLLVVARSTREALGT